MQHLISEYSCNQISQTSRSFYSLLKENIKYKTEYCEEELEAREYKHVMFYSLQSYQSYSAVWWSWNSGPDCTIGARLSHPTNSYTLRLSRTQLLLISINCSSSVACLSRNLKSTCKRSDNVLNHLKFLSSPFALCYELYKETENFQTKK